MERVEARHSAEEPSAAHAPSREAVLGELERLLSSRAFEAARAQKKFLQYTIAETVAGRGHLLKEYSLTLEAFGRSKSFAPRLNNIVRVEASKLRAKLAKYYETEGHQDAVRIEFPKGQYTSVFRCPVEVREVPRPAEALPPEGEIVPAPGIEPAVGRTPPMASSRCKWPPDPCRCRCP